MRNPHGPHRGTHQITRLVYWKIGAGDGAQTRDLRLGKATLYQLSYSRSRV